MKKVFLLVLLITQCAFGQEFTGGAPLPQPAHDGFYRVKLPPEVTAFLEQDCSNARIIDGSGAEVPYIFEEDSKRFVSEFKEYKVVEKTHRANCCTSLIIENNTNHVVDNLLLRVRNAEVNKTASLIGSDDRKQWFALKENFSLSNFNGAGETSELRVLNFPSSDYKYYRLMIDDSVSPPLDIRQVGFIEGKLIDPSYTSVVPESAVEKDSVEAKKTFYSVVFPGNVWIDRIEITAGGLPYFHRTGILFEVVQERTKKGALVESLQPITSFDISSEGSTPVDVSGARGKKFVVIIENEDNPPVNIESLKVYQLNRYLTTYLRSGSEYSLRWGSNLRMPVYDLSHFKEKIPANADVIEPGMLFTQEVEADQSIALSAWRSPLLIWAGIILIILLLGWMSLSMIRETRAKKDVQ